MGATSNHKSRASALVTEALEMIDCARHDISDRMGLLDAIDMLEMAARRLREAQAAVFGRAVAAKVNNNAMSTLLREIHAAWALANHVPSDAPGSWESQMMRKIECVLGTQEVQA